MYTATHKMLVTKRKPFSKNGKCLEIIEIISVKKLFTKESLKKKNILIYKQSISLLSNKPFVCILIYIKVRHQFLCLWKRKKKKKFSTIMPPVGRT